MNTLFTHITTCKPLSKEDEKVLFEKAAAGDKKARDTIINSNIKFVISIAKTYKNCGVPFEDLIQDGIEGLLIAYNKFNYHQNVKFITYAVWWIKLSIKKAAYYSSKAVRIPLNRSDLFQAQEYAGVSLDAPIAGDKSNKAIINTISDYYYSDFDEKYCVQDLITQISKKIRTFSPNEKYIVNEYYGLSGNSLKTYRQIASELHYSHETVRAYEKKALSKLRNII